MPSKKKLRKRIKRLETRTLIYYDQAKRFVIQSELWEERFFELMRETGKNTFITSDGVCHVANPQCSQGIRYTANYSVITKDTDVPSITPE